MFFKSLELFLLLLLRQSLIGSAQSTPTIISEGRTTHQSSTYLSFFASYAVDGSTDGTCTETMLEDTNPWWYVDLGMDYRVEFVYIYTTTGANLDNVEVHVTSHVSSVRDSSNKCGTITLSSTNDYYYSYCGPSIPSGRYVYVFQSPTLLLKLCEVQVYGVTASLCASSPCLNGGICNAFTSSYICSCPVSYTGLHCQTFDNQEPSVMCPTDRSSITSSNQIQVTWDDPSVTDNIDGTGLSATCLPPSGSMFPVSSTVTVTCEAIDDADNKGVCQFTVTVSQDTTEPVVTCPADMNVNTVSNDVVVDWADPVVTDDTYTGLSAICSPFSGSLFPVGSTNVTCYATDGRNTGYCTFQVNVIETGDPIVVCPSAINMDTDTSAATVTWDDPSVTDNIDSGLSAVCSPSSGSSFPVGSTDVTCTATDSAGNGGSCTFTVEINDAGNPTILCSDVEMSTATSAATVTWNDPLVTDNVDTGLSAMCSPSSGSTFPVGSTVITCTATDNAGNEGSCNFTLTVIENGMTDSSNSTLIVVIVVILLLILIIVAVILIFKIRKKRQPGKSKNVIPLSSIPNGRSRNEGEQHVSEPLAAEDEKTQEESIPGDTANTYMNQDHQQPAIAVKDLPEYVREKKAAGKLTEEWELLPEGIKETERKSVAFESHNTVKNRYRNVIPYDKHRVVLEAIEDVPFSDYINASYIMGYSKDNAYIAAQGPNKATLNDFWRMIWQENVPAIIMSTNLVEDGKNKCTKYWPEDTKNYGELTVTSLNVISTTSFTIRKLQVVKGAEMRHIQHYHYVVWPDKSVPRSSSPVIKMLNILHQDTPTNAGPILVHCSAGAGRTGAIITIDSMIKMANETEEINVFEFVKDMRNRRPNMVQTPLQYEFIYSTLLEYIIFGDTSCDVPNFTQHYKKLRETNPKSKKTYLSEEFDALQSVSATLDVHSTKGGLRPGNLEKNRYSDKIPFDRNRPYIMTPGPSGSTDYINASFFDSFDKKDMFIGAQAPMENTVEDFWRMVFDYNTRTVVVLNDFNNRDKSVAHFWPENSSQFNFTHLTVSLLTTECLSKQVTQHTVNVVKNDDNKSSEVKIFQYLGWPANSYAPTSSMEFLQLVTVVNSWQSEIGDPTVVVMCLDGLGRTGVFCATISCLRQSTEEQTIDVAQSVKLLRNNRPGMVQTMSQYDFIYKTLQEHLLANEVYDNLPQDEGLYANV